MRRLYGHSRVEGKNTCSVTDITGSMADSQQHLLYCAHQGNCFFLEALSRIDLRCWSFLSNSSNQSEQILVISMALFVSEIEKSEISTELFFIKVNKLLTLSPRSPATPEWLPNAFLYSLLNNIFGLRPFPMPPLEALVTPGGQG